MWPTYRVTPQSYREVDWVQDIYTGNFSLWHLLLYVEIWNKYVHCMYSQFLKCSTFEWWANTECKLRANAISKWTVNAQWMICDCKINDLFVEFWELRLPIVKSWSGKEIKVIWFTSIQAIEFRTIFPVLLRIQVIQLVQNSEETLIDTAHLSSENCFILIIAAYLPHHYGLTYDKQLELSTRADYRSLDLHLRFIIRCMLI